MYRSRGLAIVALAMSVIVIGTVTALLTTQLAIQGSGSIKGVGLGIYWDLACTNTTSSLDFGQLEPGSAKNFTLFLRNEGNSALALNMTAQNWNPANATDNMALTWNREGQQVNPDQVMGFVIVLSVSENITGISTFSFDIVISGTG